jgi:amidase
MVAGSWPDWADHAILAALVGLDGSVICQEEGMSTFITKLDAAGTGPRLAVKDLIDVAGVPTTAGSRAVAQTAAPATADAACLAGARAAGARIVGKTNLHELAMLPLGTNQWFGTPVNPLDPALIPGGSSSGSATAVAVGEADVALGSDTGGSIRIPAACCGITGLKTSYGRVPMDGVWPLAPSLDTVGPMAATVDGLVTGMALLEPGFAPATAPARRIGRLRTAARPEIEQAVDEALKAAEFEVVTLDWDGLAAGTTIFTTICLSEIWDTDHALAQAHPDAVGDDIRQTLVMADLFRPGLVDARNQLAAWRQSLLDLFAQVELLALPTLPVFPPRLDDLTPDSLVNVITEITQYTGLFNAAGTPCTAQPVRAAGIRLPASLQFVGPPRGEELLLATASQVEAAAG